MVLGAIGVGVLVGALVWGLLVWELERAEVQVRGWVRDELAQHGERAQVREQERALRVACAELMEELEYIDARVAADSHDYWAKY